ncbi:MAG: hypothetical protein C4343_03720 [Chloroflexota bacterium]
MLARGPSLCRRLLRALAIGVATNLLYGQLALAHTPVAGAFSAGSAVTYEFRGHYKGETGLDPNYSPIFAITWSTAC